MSNINDLILESFKDPIHDAKADYAYSSISNNHEQHWQDHPSDNFLHKDNSSPNHKSQIQSHVNSLNDKDHITRIHHLHMHTVSIQHNKHTGRITSGHGYVTLKGNPDKVHKVLLWHHDPNKDPNSHNVYKYPKAQPL